MAVDIGPVSIVILRDDDDHACALSQRGARIAVRGLVAPNRPVRWIGKLVLPYHQWTYDLDGALARARIMGIGFRRGPSTPQAVRFCADK